MLWKLAIWDRFVLLQGGYHSDDWQVIKLTEGAVRIGESFILQTPEGKLLPAASSAVRNDAIWFLEDGDVYCCDRHQ